MKCFYMKVKSQWEWESVFERGIYFVFSGVKDDFQIELQVSDGLEGKHQGWELGLYIYRHISLQVTLANFIWINFGRWWFDRFTHAFDHCTIYWSSFEAYTQ